MHPLVGSVLEIQGVDQFWAEESMMRHKTIVATINTVTYLASLFLSSSLNVFTFLPEGLYLGF